MTSPGEVVSVFTSPYLSAGAPSLGEAKGLIELNLYNFNTDNVTNMSSMFSACSSLKELNLNNLNTNNVTDMSGMFYECSSLKELNLSNFNTNNVTNMRAMFYGCSDELKLKIRGQYKNFQEITFDDYDNSDDEDDIDIDRDLLF